MKVMKKVRRLASRFRGQQFPGGRLRLAGLAALAVTSSALEAQTTVLPEIQVTKSSIPDNEYDSAKKGIYCPTCNGGSGNSRWTFTDPFGNLYLANIDWNTGEFVPPDGHGLLLDVNTAAVVDFGNGPEWMSSKAGSQIVYTRYKGDSRSGTSVAKNPRALATDTTPCISTAPPPPDPTTAQIAVATQVNGVWTTRVLANSLNRATPEGSLDEDDPDPRINYIAADKSNIYWRQMSQPDVEHVLPINQLSGGNSRRWVPGTRKIIFQGHLPSDPKLIDQIFTVDTDTNEVEQLTFDPNGKYGAFMWKAPEFNNEYVFFTMGTLRKQLFIYRKLAGIDGVMRWTVIKVVNMPAALPYMFSPEPFVHNGRSYVMFNVSSSSAFYDKSIPTQIGFTGIDPLRMDFRLLTNDTQTPRLRLDPEFFITAQGPFIYYNRLIPATVQCPDGINDGIWRVDTKLGPPKG